MKVYTGARGSGKTYNLAHAVMGDEDGVLVVRDDLVEWNESEYPEIRGRVLRKDDVQGTPPRTVLYIDDVNDGDDLYWADTHRIGGIAVNPKRDLLPDGISEEYINSLMTSHYSQ